MTQEEKNLLLQDLCARLPYNVKVNHLLDTKPSDLFAIDTYRNTLYCFRNGREEWYKVEFIKPYLRPLSSMTESEREELKTLCDKDLSEFAGHLMKGHGLSRDGLYMFDKLRQLDWLNAHHFDYRGLIPKGLANKAPEGMYDS